MSVINVAMFIGLALLGRWMQLHPEKMVRKGWFSGENTFGAKLHRAQATIFGSVAVLGGTSFALSGMLRPITSGHTRLHFVAWSVAIAGGALTARYVRKEVRNQPPYESKSPYGWWP